MKESIIIKTKSLKEAREEFEARYIRTFLRLYNGHVSKIARKLKVPRQNMYIKFRKYGINPKYYRKRLRS